MKKPNINEMTLREKIAQTLIVRQSDLMLRADMDYKEAREPDEAALLMEKYQFGGIWAHGNIDVTGGMKDNLCKSFNFTSKTMKAWIDEVCVNSKYPVICAADATACDGYSDLSRIGRGLNVGAANSEDLCFRLGKAVAKEHSLAGINWLWTPICDLANPMTSGVTRPFAVNPETLISSCRAFIQGMQSENVAGCIKHFPGKDSFEWRDSHIVPTKIRNSVEEWEKRQGRVFKELIDSGVYTAMTSGGVFVDAQKGKSEDSCVSSALAYEVTTGLLKEKFGFEGVVVTDDVTMGCFTSFYNHDNLYPEFLKAGNDMLLGVGIDAVDIVERAVKDGRLSEERIDDACQRVLDLKEKIGLFETKQKSLQTLEEVKKETSLVLRELAEKSVTLIRDKENIVPLNPQKIKKVTIITYAHYPLANDLGALKAAFEKRGALVTLRDKLESFNDIEEVSQNSDLIVYAAYLGFHKPRGGPHFMEDVFWSLRYVGIEGNEKSVGLSLG